MSESFRVYHDRLSDGSVTVLILSVGEPPAARAVYLLLTNKVLNEQLCGLINNLFVGPLALLFGKCRV